MNQAQYTDIKSIMRSMTLCDNQQALNGINNINKISGRQYVQRNTIKIKPSKLVRSFALLSTLLGHFFYYILRIINEIE